MCTRMFKELATDSTYTYSSLGQKQVVKGKISEGLKKVKADPDKYQGNMTQFPPNQQQYTLLYRAKTKGFQPHVTPGGWYTVVMVLYQALPPLKQGLGKAEDEATQTMSYQGSKLHTPSHPALYPGRGDGIADVPGLKLIGDGDPSDLIQGGVGDCWLLAGVSSFAEFDGAIARLFRKNEDPHNMPQKGPNQYKVSVWELSNWTQTSVTVDERLCANAGGKPGILAASPSLTGELWPCYLEKALAIHCGGWDKIDGGQCTQLWALLTGCKEQYQIHLQPNGKYRAFGWFNPNKNQLEKLANSPHDGFQGLWPMAWPEVGGGGDLRKEIDGEDLFSRMCAWDDENYILAAGTKAGHDTQDTNGIIDGHAYSILEVVNDAAGSGCDLVKMRNPHGQKEIDHGSWSDDGPGWGKYPQVKALLHPVVADNGIFWVSKREFWKYFPTVFLCAHNMAEFLRDS